MLDYDARVQQILGIYQFVITMFWSSGFRPQSPFELLPQMARILDLLDGKSCIIVIPTGGGFGSKFDATVEPLLALTAYCTGRPVKMTLTREVKWTPSSGQR